MSGLINHISAALTGALLLARFDAVGIKYFEPTLEGFWRSFWAAGLVGPFFLLLLIIKYIQINGFTLVHHIAIESFAYVTAWVLFPLVMAGLTQHLNCAKNYISFIISYNWCSAIQHGIYLPIAILGYAGMLSPGLGNLLALSAITWILVYTFFIVNTVLNVSRITAFGIVVLDLVLGLLLDTATNIFL